MQAEGHLHEAVQDIENYVKGGFLALQYGSINYLPCYAAAGLLVKLGLFHTHGEVWSSSVSMLLPYLRNTHKVFCQYQHLYTDGADLVCASAGDARPVLVCYILFCIPVMRAENMYPTHSICAASCLCFALLRACCRNV